MPNRGIERLDPSPLTSGTPPFSPLLALGCQEASNEPGEGSESPARLQRFNNQVSGLLLRLPNQCPRKTRDLR